MREFIAFVRKEFYHIFRDKRTMLILLVMPVVQIILFGFAISTQIRNIDIAIVSPDRDETSRKIAEKLDANDYFTFVGYLNSVADVDVAMKEDRVDIALVLDANFEDNLRAGKSGDILISVDASNPNTSAAESNYLTGILADFFGNAGAQNGISTNVHLLYNPQMESSYNFVPGIMGLILMLICAMMTSISIVREKEIGTMEVLLVSPTKPIYIIWAKMVPYFVLSCANYITILLLSVFVLGLPVAGSLFWLTVLSLLYIFMALALGLLISTIMSTQVVAMLASVMGLMLPTIMLSGMVFPIESAPPILQYVSWIVPGRWYISGVRKIMIEGLPVSYISTEFIVLGVMSALLVFISLKKFKNRLE